MKRNKINIIMGNKGGVGKSLIAMLIADYIIRLGLAAKLICGDAEMTQLQRTFGIQMLHSSLVDEERIRVFDFMSDVGMENFIDEICAMENCIAVIDTGANMQQYITSQADFLADCAEDMGDVTFIFVVSPAEESADALQDFLVEAGEKFRIRIVLMAPEDIPAEGYALMKSPKYTGTRMFLEKGGSPVHFLGQIPERFFQMMMRDERKIPATILESLESRAMWRRFACWLREVIDPIMDEILGEISETESELVSDKDFETDLEVGIEPDIEAELEAPNA